jgi:hypothetical protein
VRKTTVRSLKKKAWKIFSQWIRLKDTDEGGTAYCYTCGDPKHWKELQAGHAIPGRHNSVLFDEEIVRPQCAPCNIWKRGCYHVFTTKLIKENGLIWWEGKLTGSKRIVKYDRVDLEELIEKYNRKVAEIAMLRRTVE